MNRRKGFSLIELLVVITIMGLVIALLFRATLGTSDSGRIASTKTTITKLDSILKERLAAFQKKSMRNAASAFTAAYNAGGNPPAIGLTNDKVSAVFMRKLEYRSTFPQRLEDLYGIDGAPNTPDDAYLLSLWLQKTGGVLFPPGHDRKHESAKLLYLSIMDGQSQMTDSINSRHVAYLDPNDKTMGLAAFVDDWGNALRFYNWPTRLIRPGGDGASVSQATFDRSGKMLIGLEIPKSPSPLPYPDQTNGAQSLNVNQDSDDPAMIFVHARLRSVFGQPSQPNYFASAFSLSGWRPAYRRSSANTSSFPTISGAAAPFDEASYHTLLTFHRPMIVSCGSDGELGLEEPTAAGALRLAMPKSGEEELIADDITNLKR